MIAFNCYKNLKTIIGMKRGETAKVKKFHITTETGKYTLYLSKAKEVLFQSHSNKNHYDSTNKEKVEHFVKL